MKSRITLLILFSLLLTITVFSQSYDIYVSEAGNYGPPNYILKFDQNGENGEIFIDEELNWPQDIVFLEDRNEVLISNLTTNKITKYNADDGSYIGDFATDVEGPTRMKIGEDGLLYVILWKGNNPVIRYDLDGNFVDEFTDTGIPKSIGMDWDADGNLYVSSYNNFVQKFSPEGEDLGRIVESNLNGPTNLWFDEDGNMKVINWGNGLVQTFDSTGAFTGTFITGATQGEGIAVLPNGDLLIGSGGNDAVQRYQSDGTFIGNFVVSTDSLPMILPNAVVLRETATSSTQSKIEETAFVVPTLGREFRLSATEYTGQLKQINVFNTSGQQVCRNEVNSDLLWDASLAKPGAYLLIGRLENGQLLRQRVVVAP